MAYVKTDWKNRVVEKPRTFTIQENADGTVTLIPTEGVIHEEGTPVAAAQMNKIEQGIVDAFTEIETKVDKVAGKALSTNDYTTAEKNKLAGIQAGAQVNAVTSVVGKTGAVTLVKGDVGLGSVENYGIATTAEAQAGTSNVKYMTPLRVKEAIATLPGKPVLDYRRPNYNIDYATGSESNSTSLDLLSTVDVKKKLAEIAYHRNSDYANIALSRSAGGKISSIEIGQSGVTGTPSAVVEGRYSIQIGNGAEQFSPVRRVTLPYNGSNRQMFNDVINIPITDQTVTLRVYGRKISSSANYAYVAINMYSDVDLYQV